MKLPRPTPRFALAAVAVVDVLALAWFALGLHPAPKPAPAVAKVDTVQGTAYKAHADSLEFELATVRGERDGLKGKMATLLSRLSGVEARQATVRTVYDTIIRPDTVLLTVAASSSGALTLTGGVKADSTGYQPQRLAGPSLADCDGGWAISGATVLCHRPRFGHLSIQFHAGISGPLAIPIPIPFVGAFTPSLLTPMGAAGLRWVPGYRSGWAVEARAALRGSQARLEAEVGRGIRLW